MKFRLCKSCESPIRYVIDQLFFRGGGGGGEVGGMRISQNLENDPRRVPYIGQKVSGLRHFLPTSKHRSAGQLAVIEK